MIFKWFIGIYFIWLGLSYFGVLPIHSIVAGILVFIGGIALLGSF